MESIEFRRLLKAGFFVLVILAVFLAVLVVSGLKAFNYIGSGSYPSRTISVTGEGEIFAIPDVAQFTFSVTAEGETVAVAQETVNEKIASAIEVLKQANIDEKDIKTIDYSAYPRYEYRNARTLIYPPAPESERVLVGYEVTQTLSVKVRDMSKAGDILSQIGSAGVTNVSGLSFTIDDREAILAEARELAIADAKEKAKKLSDELDIKLKRIVSFSENQGGYYPAFYDKAEVSAVGLGGASDMRSAALPMGENQVMVQVYVTYEIR